MKTVDEAQKALKKAEEELRIAKAQQALDKRVEKLSDRPSEFPPGFDFDWYHRHDPFESYWRLTFSGLEDEWLSWEISESDENVRVTARELAWGMYDRSVSICKKAGLLK